MIMQAFSKLAKMHRQKSNANYIGQLLQNAGANFQLISTEHESGVKEWTGVAWASIKKKLDKDAKAKGQSMTWPNVFETLGSLESETGLTKLIVAYSTGMLATKLAIRDIITSVLLTNAFGDKDGKFNAKTWDSWAKDNRFEVIVKNNLGEEVSRFVPSGKLLAHLIEASEELNKLAGYHSMDSVSDREPGGFDISEFTL